MVVPSISDILRSLSLEQYSSRKYLKPKEYYWMRHGESCANVVKKTCKEDKDKCNQILDKYREKKKNKNKNLIIIILLFLLGIKHVEV